MENIYISAENKVFMLKRVSFVFLLSIVFFISCASAVWWNPSSWGITGSAVASNALIPVMTSNTAPSGIVSASVGSNIAWKAFDNDQGSFPPIWTVSTNGQPQWISYQFPNVVSVDSFSITPWSDATHSPSYAQFQYLNNGQWVTAHTIGPNYNGNFGTFKLSSVVSSNAFRLYVINTPSNIALNIRTLQLYGSLSNVAPTTCTSFTYSAWSVCSASGQQTRTVVSSSPSGCVGGSPEYLAQNCIRPCTADDYTYTLSPSVCPTNGQQTMTYVKKSGLTECSGGVAAPANGTMSCIYNAPACTSYQVSLFSACSNGYRSRSVTGIPAGCSGGVAAPSMSEPCSDEIRLCGDSDWSYAVVPIGSGLKERRWSKSGNCVEGVTHSTETLSVNAPDSPSTCFSFNYGNWNPTNCVVGSKQTRTALGSSGGVQNAQCIGGSPILEQNCPENTQTVTNTACSLGDNPVCSVDEITYSNSCNAVASGATVACQGECPCPVTNPAPTTGVVPTVVPTPTVINPPSSTGTGVVPVTDNKCSSGCSLDNNCVNLGYRNNGKYCSLSGMIDFKAVDAICDNSFECGSNSCISGKCTDANLIQKIVTWFKNNCPSFICSVK